MLFKDGEVLAQKLGAMPKQDLTNFLDTNLWESTWVIQHATDQSSRLKQGIQVVNHTVAGDEEMTILMTMEI